MRIYLLDWLDGEETPTLTEGMETCDYTMSVAEAHLIKDTIEAQSRDIAELVEALGDGMSETEYGGRIEYYCYFCAKWQEDGKPAHEEDCIVAKHKGRDNNG